MPAKWDTGNSSECSEFENTCKISLTPDTTNNKNSISAVRRVQMWANCFLQIIYYKKGRRPIVVSQITSNSKECFHLVGEKNVIFFSILFFIKFPFLFPMCAFYLKE